MIYSSYPIFLVLLFCLTLATYSANIDTPTVEHCLFYSGANTTSATCSGFSEFKCIGGCHNDFVHAQGCQPKDYNGDNSTPPTNQICDVEFSMITTRVKSCVTSAGVRFSCTGATSGFATCSQCLKIRRPYSAGSSTMKSFRSRPF